MRLLIYFLFVVPSSIIHEYAHGFVADKLGDPTARYAGRLTLNPLAHIDPIGTILLPLFLAYASGGAFMFAYAKPVPYNPYNLKYPKWGPVLVGLAGPFSNLLLAAVFSVVYRFVGSALAEVISLLVLVNIVLGVFNLVPIPPLDGSKLLFALFPRSLAPLRAVLERYGFILLILFIFGAVSIINPIIEWLFSLFIGA